MFSLNYQSREPIYEQIYNNIVRMIGMGALTPNTQLPTVREMAQQLGINPNTVARSYRLLEQNGYIYSNVGRGTFVTNDNTLLTGKMEQAHSEFSKAVKAACDSGISMKEAISILMDIYTGGE